MALTKDEKEFLDLKFKTQMKECSLLVNETLDFFQSKIKSPQHLYIALEFLRIAIEDTTATNLNTLTEEQLHTVNHVRNLVRQCCNTRSEKIERKIED